jgi:hypothetical protein
VEDRLNGSPEVVIPGGGLVGPDSTHLGDIIAVSGALTVSGKVTGDCIVVDGDLSLTGESEVLGNVTILGGKIYSSKLSRIRGQVEIYDFSVEVVQKAGTFDIRRTEGQEEKLLHFELGGVKGFGLGPYNRVDGLPLLFDASLKSAKPAGGFEISAKPMYRIAAHRWGWDLRGELRGAWWFDRIGASYYSKAVTNDLYRMGDFENSIAAALIKEDFRNYYEERAVSLWCELPPVRNVAFGAGFDTARSRSLATRAELTLFGWGKEFRENPPVEEGRANSISFVVTHDTRDNVESPESGWYTQFVVERSGGALGGDFEFTRWQLNARRYNRLGTKGHLDGRLFFHHGNDPLPRIRHLTMGGVGGLRGYPDSLPGGDRLVLGSVDFRYLLTEGIPHSVLFREGLDAVVFFDAGDAKAGPDDLTLRDLKADAGVGLSGSGMLSYFGVFVGQSLTDTELDPRFTVRIARDF